LEREGGVHGRFSAGDGYKIRIEDKGTGAIFTGADLKNGRAILDPNANYVVHCPTIDWEYVPKEGKLLGAGSLGCGCSHIELWQKSYDNGVEYIISFEDDVVVSEGFKGKINDLLASLPLDSDIVFFNLTSGKRKHVFMNNFIDKVRSDTDGTVAMLIRKKAFKRLLVASSKSGLPIDNVIGILINEREINAYVINEDLVDTPSCGQGGSAISAMGR